MYLEYQLTEQEFKDFSYYAGWISPEKKLARLKYYGINLIAYLGLLAVFYLVWAKRIKTSTILITVIGALLLLLYLRFRIKDHFERSVEKLLKENGEERILSLLKLNITESGIAGTTNNIEANYKWAAFFKKNEANNCYYLYIDSRQAIIIPKRVFSSIKKKEEFEKILLTYFPLEAELDNLKK